MNAEPGSPDRTTGIGFGNGFTLLLTGGVIGLLGAFLQAVTVDLAGLSVPIGLVIVVVTLLAAIRAVIHLFDRRWAGVLVFLGWVVVSVLLAFEWPGGDVVVTRDPTAMVYLFGGAVLASAAANVPARLRPPPRPTDAAQVADGGEGLSGEPGGAGKVDP